MGSGLQALGFGPEVRSLKPEGIGNHTMEATLEATARDSFGKNEARRTRRDGRVPAVLYGATGETTNREATPIAVDPRALLKILHSESGANTLISLKLAGGDDTRVLIKE